MMIHFSRIPICFPSWTADIVMYLSYLLPTFTLPKRHFQRKKKLDFLLTCARVESDPLITDGITASRTAGAYNGLKVTIIFTFCTGIGQRFGLLCRNHSMTWSGPRCYWCYKFQVLAFGIRSDNQRLFQVIWKKWVELIHPSMGL